MQARFVTRIFDFKFPAGTSRGILHQKTSSFILLSDGDKTGIGECSVIPGLSLDPDITYQRKMQEVCDKINAGQDPDSIHLHYYPSIAFGLEMALVDLRAGGNRILFKSDFTDGVKGIPINGLIWMGDKSFMEKQIKVKVWEGYHCLKLKVGAIDFDVELSLLKHLRSQFSPGELEIRLDANGAFSTDDAMRKLDMLSKFSIHSIEQPVQPGQLREMAVICRNSPIPVVLDEELIGFDPDDASALLHEVCPAYIILKPSLLGGFGIASKWIDAANEADTGWWVTSALESNVGLNAIAQWAYTLENPMPHGLGTGQLYNNNIPSLLEIKDAMLWHKKGVVDDLGSLS